MQALMKFSRSFTTVVVPVLIVAVVAIRLIDLHPIDPLVSRLGPRHLGLHVALALGLVCRVALGRRHGSQLIKGNYTLEFFRTTSCVSLCGHGLYPATQLHPTNGPH